MTTLKDFQDRIGYIFQDPSLLVMALTHRSYAFEHASAEMNNQRLEFLGDAILDFVIGDVLYHLYPSVREGELSRMRSRLVCEGALCQLARKLDFEAEIRMGKGEISSSGMMRDGTLADAYEAVIGAVYLDGGIDAARAYILRHHQSYIADPDGSWLAPDDKTRLQEIVQSAHKTLRYEIMNQVGPSHAPSFEMGVWIGDVLCGHGIGRNKKEAQQAAARDALSHMES